MKKSRNMRPETKRVFSLDGASGISILILFSFVTMMAVWAVSSQCDAIAKEIGRAERRLDACRAELSRESDKWEEFKTTEKLETALARFGLEMGYPKANQTVRMDGNGKPAAGQITVARARSRAASRSGRMAKNYAAKK